MVASEPVRGERGQVSGPRGSVIPQWKRRRMCLYIEFRSVLVVRAVKLQHCGYDYLSELRSATLFSVLCQFSLVVAWRPGKQVTR